MTALEILKDVIGDGYLSETNMQRGRQLLDYLARVGTDHAELLADCRAEFQRGARIPAVKRFRSGTGCSLREARDAVGQGAA